MNNLNRFDAHCHIFTLRYGLREVKSMLWDMLCRRYPFTPPNKLMATKGITDHLAKLKETLRWFYQFCYSATGTEEKNLDFLIAKAKKIYPNDTHSIIPLMMDIFYMFAYPMDEDFKSTKVLKSRMIIEEEVDMDEFQKEWNEVLDDFKNHIETTTLPLKSMRDANIEYANNDILILIEEERSVTDFKSNLAQLQKKSQINSYKHSSGFDYHLKNLIDLVKKRSGEVYPFIAVDPRRNGMVKAVINGNFISKNGPFYGVKLYPRLGYHPNCAALQPLYKFCEDKQIPITYHCGKGGFPPVKPEKWESYKFGDPLNFIPILEKHNNLILNFAHMGSSDPSGEWAESVNKIINNEKYPNVYTDLSCYTSIDEIKNIKTKYWDKSERIRERLMFGTDFELFYITEPGLTIEKYYQNFMSVFSAPKDMEQIMVKNPARFLRV